MRRVSIVDLIRANFPNVKGRMKWHEGAQCLTKLDVFSWIALDSEGTLADPLKRAYLTY